MEMFNTPTNQLPIGRSAPPSQYIPQQFTPNRNLVPPSTSPLSICRCSAASFPHRHPPPTSSTLENSSHTTASSPGTRSAILDPPVPTPNNLPPPSQLEVHIQPHWDTSFQNAIAQPYAQLSCFDTTVSVVTDNLALASPNLVTYDARWLEGLTQLPLELRSKYLPVVPDDTLIRQNEYGVVGRKDINGPPEESKWYSWWTNSDPRVTFINDNPNYWLSINELGIMTSLFNATHDNLNSGRTGLMFTLPLIDRENLYKKLFHPIIFEVGHNKELEGYVEDIIFSKVYEIFAVENFLLETLNMFKDFGVSQFPKPRLFLEDLYYLLDTLYREDDADRDPARVKMSEIGEDLRLDQISWWIKRNHHDTEFVRRWNARWSGIPVAQYTQLTIYPVIRGYVCALFDATFGLWPAPGHCFLHDDDGKMEVNDKDPGIYDIQGLKKEDQWVSAQAAIPRCINSGLYFWESLPPQPDVASVDETTENLEKVASVSLRDLDAFLIEKRLPFEFKSTKRLEEHLTIDVDQHILIFIYWKQFLMLRHHKVLVYDARPDYPADEISRFQLLSRSTRTPNDRMRGTGGDVRYIAYELLRTYALLFKRGVSDSGGYYRHEARVLGRRSLFNWEKSSKEIADRLKLDFSGFDELVRILGGGRLCRTTIEGF